MSARNEEEQQEELRFSNPTVDIYEELNKFQDEWEMTPDDGVRSIPIREQKEISDLLHTLDKYGMEKEKAQFNNLLNYTESMEKRFSEVSKELSTIREQLSEIQNKASKSMVASITEQMQSKVNGTYQGLKAWKNGLVAAAGGAVHAFKEKGKAALKASIEKMQIPKALTVLKDRFASAKNEASESAAKIRLIREEMYKAKEHLKNVGRAMSGKQVSPMEISLPEKGLLHNLEQRYEKIEKKFERKEELTDRCIKSFEKCLEKLNPTKKGEEKLKDTANAVHLRKAPVR